MVGVTVFGPILACADKPTQARSIIATATDIVNTAVLAASKVG